jgi:hypothetical protein
MALDEKLHQHFQELCAGTEDGLIDCLAEQVHLDAHLDAGHQSPALQQTLLGHCWYCNSIGYELGVLER